MGHCSRLERINDWEFEVRHAKYSARVLAKACMVSDRQLRRYFLHRFGVPTQKWIDHLRLTRARQLLQNGYLVKEIAFDLGFKHVSRFCEFFKRESGTTATSSIVIGKPLTSVRRNKSLQTVNHYPLSQEIQNIVWKAETKSSRLGGSAVSMAPQVS